MKYYFSFGFGHHHHVDGIEIDRNCIVSVEVEATACSPESERIARKIFTDWLGDDYNWSFQRNEDEYKSIDANKYFPRGIVKEL